MYGVYIIPTDSIPADNMPVGNFVRGSLPYNVVYNLDEALKFKQQKNIFLHDLNKEWFTE